MVISLNLEIQIKSHSYQDILKTEYVIGDGKIFSGDTLFVGNCGRIDLPGGSAKELYHSLFDILYSLDDDLVMYPGHNYGSSETSTIGKEKDKPCNAKKIEQEFIEMMGQ